LRPENIFIGKDIAIGTHKPPDERGFSPVHGSIIKELKDKSLKILQNIDSKDEGVEQ
jgi:hypothetical protein